MGNHPSYYLSKIVNTGDRLRIEIPAKPQWSEIKHLVLWLCGWAVGEIVAFVYLINATIQGTLLSFSLLPVTLFVIVWLAVWGAIGAFTLQKLLKLAKIKEVLIMEANYLTLQRVYVSGQNQQTFDPDKIRGLHASPMAIMFDYAEQTYAFGQSLDHPEANYIVNLIQQRLPSQVHQDSDDSDW